MKGQEEREGVGDEGRKGKGVVWALGARLWVWGIVCGQGASFVGRGADFSCSS